MKNKINISNYKEFWNKYLEGILSETDEEILFDFLEKKPELFDNLEEDVDTKLDAPNIVFKNKEKLFAENQTDLLLIAKTENVISSESDKIITEKIKTDNNVRRDYELYKKAKVHADLSVKHPDKNSLKKAVAIPLYRRIAAVAALIALVYVAGNFVFDNQQEEVFVKTAGITNFDKITKPIATESENESLDENTELSDSGTPVKPINNGVENKLQFSASGYEIANLERMPIKQATPLNFNINDAYQLPVLRTPDQVAMAVGTESHISTYSIEYIKAEQENRLLSSVNKVLETGREFNINESIRNLRDKRNELVISANN